MNGIFHKLHKTEPDVIRSGIKPDLIAAVAIFILALLLRLPFLSYPAEPLMDESNFAADVANTLSGKPLFIAHPPLSIMVFSLLAKDTDLSRIQWYDKKHVDSFDGFPFERIRRFDVILGSLLAVVVFIIGRILGLGRFMAILPAVLVVFDNSLINHSRIITPDALMPFLGFTGILFVLASDKITSAKLSWVSLIIGAIFIGLVTAVKLTGIGYFEAVCIYFAFKKAWKNILKVAAVVSVVYVGTFIIYMNMLPGGLVYTEGSWRDDDYISSLYFPKSIDPIASVKLFINYNIALVRMDLDETITIADTGKPWRWPLAFSPLNAWHSPPHDRIIAMTGNYFSWWLAFIAVLYFLAKYFSAIYKSERFSFSPPLFCLLCYWATYIPFFFMSMARNMFMYNYFLPLIFGYLLISFALTDIVSNFSFRGPKFQNELLKRSVIVIILGTILMFARISSFTYGY